MLTVTSSFNRIILLASLVTAMAFCVSVKAAEDVQQGLTQVQYSHSPGVEIISFREIFPEFADQDSTPLLRIYGDGRVIVHHPTYMKFAGQYEMHLSPQELDELVYQLTSALNNFKINEIKRQKAEADIKYVNSLTRIEDLVVTVESDPEISVFNLNIESIQFGNPQQEIVNKPRLDRSWQGLGFDARNYPENESIQNLMQVENALRALAKSEELVFLRSVK